MRELNGFKIDQYNQHGIKEGAKVSTCPLCSATRKKKTDKCLSVHWDRGIGNCNHCSEVVQLHTYKRETEKEWIKPKWSNQTNLSEPAVKWFEETRGISQETLTKLKISEGLEWMPQKKREVNTIQFNYFLNNELINVKYRTGDKCFKLHKGSEKIFYNIESIRHTDEAVIVEGEMDVLAFCDSGIDYAVSVPNGATIGGNINLDYLDSCYEFFENKNKIYLATDNDEAGLNLRTELIRRLGAENCYLLDFEDCKDANDYMIKYGKQELQSVLDNAIQCPLENTITLNDEREQLRDFYLNGAKPGFQIGLKSFDENFSTYTSQYITVTGVPGSGKSDFVDMMVTGYERNYKWKTAFASPENKPTWLHLDKLCRKYYGKYPKGEGYNDLDTNDWLDVEQHVNDNFYFMDYERGFNLSDVLKKGAELVKRKGIKCLVIDPFNKVRLKSSSNKSVTDYTADYLNEIDDFCRTYDVLVIVVAHPTKMSLEEGTKKFKEPTMYDVKGGGEWYDMSYHGLLIHRDYEFKTVKVKVLKLKFHHLGNDKASAHFAWSPVSGRYNEITGEPEHHQPDYDNTNWLNGRRNIQAEPVSDVYEQKTIDANDDFINADQDPF